MDLDIEAAVLKRMIEPNGNGLPVAVARLLLDLDFDARDHRRLNELSKKAQDANLSARETRELDSYLHLSHFLALLKSKARRSLRQTPRRHGIRRNAE